MGTYYAVYSLTTSSVFFMPEDIDRFIRDLRAAKSTIKLEGPDQDSVESRYRKALSMRGLVRIVLPLIPHPGLMLCSFVTL